ncbi:putative porin [Pseudoalteromonas phenolica]|uniref:putative porin n=1 Tax=Pseudoalteromonas phenolica TaxID=161398 RepID=UPI00110A1C50|nr:putative porin [Pseudoalteromonas phenolica]TMO57169.1 putative porin [Pseudoalteromonas phenolica]
MKKLLPVAIILALSSFSSVADESKQSFNYVNFAHVDGGENAYHISTHYFLAPQQHSGVWDDFGYLNTDSNIQLAYQRTDHYRDLSVSGEWFATKEWFVSAGSSDVGHINDDTFVGFGYLFDNKLKLSARYEKHEHANNHTMLTAEYNHQINDTDYLGVTLNTESDFDTWSLASRYFMHIEGDSFFSVDMSHSDYDGFDKTNVIANYYISRNLSFGAGSYDSDLGIQAKYFFNDKFNLGGSIIDFDDGEIYQLSFTAQY